jgi:hypothetical protein
VAVSIINASFLDKSAWLQKAATEMSKYKWKFVLVPSADTQYVERARQHTASVCVKSKLTSFETPENGAHGKARL